MLVRCVTAVTAIPVARVCERLRPVPEILGDTAQTIKRVGNGNRKPFLDLLPHEIVLGVHRRRDALVKKLRFRRGTWGASFWSSCANQSTSASIRLTVSRRFSRPYCSRRASGLPEKVEPSEGRPRW
jgi:hypothetical protein